MIDLDKINERKQVIAKDIEAVQGPYGRSAEEIRRGPSTAARTNGCISAV
jgi:hypothetical protein